MTKRESYSRIGVLVGIAIFGILWFADPTYAEDSVTQQLWKSLVFRALGSTVFLSLSIYLGYHAFGRPCTSWWKVVLPCLAVVINNFPIIGVASGRIVIDRPDLMGLFLADALLIGVFEELAFRGTLFLAILEKRRNSTKQIFLTTLISSAIFGLVHLANLLEGAGAGATLMQVGYSFLIGGMCAIVLLKSGNLLFCILLHALFDVGGGFLTYVGTGKQWDTLTVVITAVLAVAVTAWMLYVLMHVKPKETDRFFVKTSTESGNTDASDRQKTEI